MYEIHIPISLPTAWAEDPSPFPREHVIEEIEKMNYWFFDRFGGLRQAAVALATVADYERKNPLAVLALLHASKEL